jgi:hypothetical protein
MKKILISTLAALLVSGGALAVQGGKTAAQQVNVSFNPQSFSVDGSDGPGSISDITNGSKFAQVVLITVYPTTNADFPRAGINLKNCKATPVNVTHVNVGSSALCDLSSDPANPVTITSDTKGVPAWGSYQIERP